MNLTSPVIDSPIPSEKQQAILRQVHEDRMIAHWGKNWQKSVTDHWPQTREEWNQTNYGAPWDSNVHMAKFHLKLAFEIVRNVL